MKKCPYCGKEYPDDTTACVIDGETLRAQNTQSTPSVKMAAPDSASEPPLLFPDYQWRAIDAWKCVGIIVLLNFVFFNMISALDFYFPLFAVWRASGVGSFVTSLVHYSLELLPVFYFARTETITTILKGFGLDKKPSNYVWFGVTMALFIRLAGHFMLTHRWGRGMRNYDLAGFRRTIGVQRYLFLVPMLVLAPICEETVYRGFLFKAFRNSYRLVVSMALLVAWTANTHWPYYSRSWIAAVDLSVLTLVQCYLREKADSLWDCILCHLVFNASLVFVSYPSP